MPNRTVLDGILYVLRTGCQWKMVPRQYGSGSTCHLRLQTWARAGLFERIWRACLQHYDDLQGIDWRFQSLDSATVSAPVQRGDLTGKAPTNRGKRGTKRHMLSDANGIPLATTLSGANRHDMKMFGPTLNAIVVPRPSPKSKPRQHLCCDKGYDYPELRRSAARRGYVAHIKVAWPGRTGTQGQSQIQGQTLGRRANQSLAQSLSSIEDSL